MGIKKQRGRRRYFRKLETSNDLDKIKSFEFEKPETWFDQWHLHFDWKGYGNNSFKIRKPHLDKLFRHFDLLAEKTKALKNDFQLYAILLDFDSAHDALFLHTSNPNNSQFPFEIPDLTPTSTLTNKPLNAYINALKGYERLYGNADEAFCLLFRKDIGIPFR